MNNPNEVYYRVTFFILWLIYLIVRLFYQRQIKTSTEYTRVNENQEKFLFRIFSLAYLLLVLYFLTTWIDFASLNFPQWLRWIGVIISISGIGLFAWSHQALGNNWTAILALAKEHQLVTSGPYRYVRHPMYSAFFVIGAGFFILSANWLLALIYFVPLTTMYFARVNKEEQMMIDRFGDEYREYMKKTGRIFPRL